MAIRARTLIPLGLLLGFAAALAVFGGGGGEITADPTVTTFEDLEIPDPPLPTTSTSSAAQRAVSLTRPSIDLPLSDQPPALAGSLIVVTGRPGVEQQLVLWNGPADQQAFDLPEDATRFDVDASGNHIAFLMTNGDNRQLHIAEIDGPPPLETTLLTTRVIEFVWSGDEPRRIAWLTSGLTSQDRVLLAATTADPSASYARILEALPVKSRLFGVNSWGSWVGYEPLDRPGSSWVSYTSAEGESSSLVPADLAIVPPGSSRALLADLDVGLWEWMFGLADEGIAPLAWAPGDASGETAFAAISGGKVAFIGGDPIETARSWLEVWSVDGGGGERIAIPFDIRDVRWTPEGRHVVMSGGNSLGAHVVVVFDTTGRTLHAVQFDDEIQFAAVAP